MGYNSSMELHKYLTDFSEYNTVPPLYIKNPLSEKHVAMVRDILDDLEYKYGIVDASEQSHHHQPRIMRDLSRVVTEFEMPQEIEKIIDGYILPMYKHPIKLSHFSYLGYDGKYSDYEITPSLPPHIDAAHTLLTFNYQLGGNFDWDLYVDGEKYELRNNDAVIFSSVNQVHWRPKRKWQKGDFCEILTVNYSPLDDWRFDPHGIDPLQADPELLSKYQEDLDNHPRMQKSWQIYNDMGLELGIPAELHGVFDGL